jgi:acyl-CoA hydrolase
MTHSPLDHVPTSSLEMTLLMTPERANFGGKVHGGQMLRLLDEVAFACASRYCGRYVVTLSVDQVLFKEAILIGELVTFLASVNYTGRTSMEVGIKVVAEAIRERHVRHAMTCYFTMVAVDDEGRPSPVPPYSPQDPAGRQRKHAAQLRRQLRAEVEARYLEIKKSGVDTSG